MTRWHTTLAIDFDAAACATYSANFPQTRVVCDSVANVAFTRGQADVILGGVPCQPHSQAGKRLASKDARDCGPDFVAAIRTVQPRHFLMENVPGLLSSEGGAYWHRLYASMEDAGYVVKYRVQDAVSFGVPQFRNRLWVWGIRRDLYAAGMRHRFPKPTHAWPWPTGCMFGAELLPAVTVGWALNIPHMQVDGVWFGGDGKTPFEKIGIPRSINKRAGNQWHPVSEPSIVIDGEGGHSLATEYRWSEGGAEGLLRVHEPKHPCHLANKPDVTIRSGGMGHLQPSGPDQVFVETLAIPKTLALPAATISAGSHSGGPEPINNRIRAGYVRRLTALECALLQSVPDSFRWPEKISKTAQYRVIGNGVACGHGHAFSKAFSSVDPEAITVISLFCGGGLLDCGWHGRFWTFERPAE